MVSQKCLTSPYASCFSCRSYGQVSDLPGSPRGDGSHHGVAGGVPDSLHGDDTSVLDCPNVDAFHHVVPCRPQGVASGLPCSDYGNVIGVPGSPYLMPMVFLVVFMVLPLVFLVVIMQMSAVFLAVLLGSVASGLPDSPHGIVGSVPDSPLLVASSVPASGIEADITEYSLT